MRIFRPLSRAGRRQVILVFPGQSVSWPAGDRNRRAIRI